MVEGLAGSFRFYYIRFLFLLVVSITFFLFIFVVRVFKVYYRYRLLGKLVVV